MYFCSDWSGCYLSWNPHLFFRNYMNTISVVCRNNRRLKEVLCDISTGYLAKYWYIWALGHYTRHMADRFLDEMYMRSFLSDTQLKQKCKVKKQFAEFKATYATGNVWQPRGCCKTLWQKLDKMKTKNVTYLQNGNSSSDLFAGKCSTYLLRMQCYRHTIKPD